MKQEIAAENPNKYFSNIGVNLTSCFEKYLANCNTVMNDAQRTDEEVRSTFFSLKANKSPGENDIFFHAINNVFNFMVEPIRHIFINSFGPRNISGRNENCTNNAYIIQMWR